MTNYKRNMIYAYIFLGMTLLIVISGIVNYIVYHPELTSAQNFRENWETYLLALVNAGLAGYFVYRAEKNANS